MIAAPARGSSSNDSAAAGPSRRRIYGWEDMFEFERIEDPHPSWRSAVPVAGCSPVEHETTWLARLGHGRWLHVRGRHHCPICTGGWFCVGEAHGRVTTLAKLGGLLDADEVRGLLAAS